MELIAVILKRRGFIMKSIIFVSHIYLLKLLIFTVDTLFKLFIATNNFKRGK